MNRPNHELAGLCSLLLLLVGCSQNSADGGAGAGGSQGAGGASSASGGNAMAGTLGAGGGSGTGGATAPSQICDEPASWPVPSTTKVVGDGSAESCTSDALKQAVSAGGYVTFSCGSGPVTIQVSSSISVGTQTVVEGGAGNITLDGGGTTRIFWVPSNRALSVRNLRFINGKSPAVDADASGIGGAVGGDWRSKIEVRHCVFEDNTAGRGGGAVSVWTDSSLTVVGSRFLRNHSWYGGAIYSLLSPLTVVNSEFIDNTTLTDKGTGDGGAIGTDGASASTDDAVGGKIEICGSAFRGNRGYGAGGAAYIWVYPPDQVIIDRTTVEGNANGKNGKGASMGGAMRISNGEIVIKGSSFLGNSAEGNGGGFYLDCAPSCTITNSTLYANKSAGWGGAIFSGTASGRISLNNATVADNTQQNTQANAFFGSATWVMNNTIFSNNGCATAGTGAHVIHQGGTGTCVAGAQSGDPKLGAPADNGGPTYTMLPSAGSAVLGAGADCESTDQRGQMRDPAACDVGSVELPN